MKLIITLAAIAVFLILAAMLVLSLCRESEVVHSTAGRRYSIDTITIHGVAHEFLIRENSQYFSGITHSPECPCLKKGE